MFSKETLEAVTREANAAGIVGSTAVSVELRKALNDAKKFGIGGDHRQRTYYVACWLEDGVKARWVEGLAESSGLPALAGLAKEIGLAFWPTTSFSFAELHPATIAKLRNDLSRAERAEIAFNMEKGTGFIFHVFTDEEAAQEYIAGA